MFGVGENFKTLFINSMEKWRVMMCEGNMEIGQELELDQNVRRR